MNAPIRVRLSPALRAALDGASGNVSAAMRALLIVGLASAGYGLDATLMREARMLAAGGELDAPLVATLEGLSGQRRTGVGQVSYAPPVTEQIDAMAADPLATVGIDV